jgi:hypothetical protein
MIDLDLNIMNTCGTNSAVHDTSDFAEIMFAFLFLSAADSYEESTPM